MDSDFFGLKLVKKTNKVIILQEDSLFGGIANDISAMIMENCFEHFDAPVKRVESLESAIPFMKSLEDQYLPKGRFEKNYSNYCNTKS
ncbi:MAG TPA: transketolase C-terminal domain-containing protein [Flavobacterium sp.]|nr:transketolase C-terminal domain-containing protein [Flavobacterium sp.]